MNGDMSYFDDSYMMLLDYKVPYNDGLHAILCLLTYGTTDMILLL